MHRYKIIPGQVSDGSALSFGSDRGYAGRVLKTSIAPVESDRLALISLSREFLRCMIEGNVTGAQAEVEFVIAPRCSMARQPWLQLRLRVIEADPEQHLWMYRAVVRKDDAQMVGYIGFHHKAPDPNLLDYSPRAVELAYTIEEEFQRNGYARESALAMMHWAHREHGVQTFALSISPANEASLKLAQSMNFRKVGERIDAVDGLEYLMLVDIEEAH